MTEHPLITQAVKDGIAPGVTVVSRITGEEFMIEHSWRFQVNGDVLWIGPLVLHSHRGWGVDIIREHVF